MATSIFPVTRRLPPPMRPIDPDSTLEKHRELRGPLVEKRLAMHQHQRVSGSLRDQPDAGHRLADARRRDQDSEVVTQKRADRLFLKFGRSAPETVVDRLSPLALIIDLERRSQGPEQSSGLVQAPARQRNVSGKIFGAVDDARRPGRGESQALLLMGTPDSGRRQGA